MEYRKDLRASSSGEPSESNDMEYEIMEEKGASSGRPEPTRGVKKTPSLRRGAAGYAELLQSAVTASIESRRDAQQTPSDPPAMPAGGDGLSTSPSKNKRSRGGHPEFQQALSPKKTTQHHMLVTQDPPRAPQMFGSPLQPDRFLGWHYECPGDFNNTGVQSSTVHSGHHV
jgi:hypothetical protein